MNVKELNETFLKNFKELSPDSYIFVGKSNENKKEISSMKGERDTLILLIYDLIHRFSHESEIPVPIICALLMDINPQDICETIKCKENKNDTVN